MDEKSNVLHCLPRKSLEFSHIKKSFNSGYKVSSTQSITYDSFVITMTSSNFSQVRIIAIYESHHQIQWNANLYFIETLRVFSNWSDMENIPSITKGETSFENLNISCNMN